MTLIETFCQIYQSSMTNPALAAKLAPRLAEIWNDMSEHDREIASSLLKLPSHSGTDYEVS